MIEESNAYTTNSVEFKTFLSFHPSHYPLQLCFSRCPKTNICPYLKHIIPHAYTCGEGSLASELVSLHYLLSYYLLFVLFFSFFPLF